MRRDLIAFVPVLPAILVWSLGAHPTPSPAGTDGACCPAKPERPGAAANAEANCCATPVSECCAAPASGCCATPGTAACTAPVKGTAEKRRPRGDMVLVSGGEFLRGGKWKVRVSSFFMDRHEVTNEAYCRFLNANPQHAQYWNEKQEIERAADGFVPKPGKEKWPVYAVAWHEAAAYAAWAGKRLPTEAQWEFAAGGKHNTKYPWGDQPITPERANFGGNVGHPVAVGSYPTGKTPEGIYDLSGNVAEWCADWFCPAYYEVAPEENPAGPQSGQRRVRRGGCHGMDAQAQQTAARGSSPPLYRPGCIGFRCVCPASSRLMKSGPSESRAALSPSVSRGRCSSSSSS